MKRATAEWVQKAEDDHAAANQLAAGNQRLHDQVCFHCQQCAEKYLKALIEEAGWSVIKTHDLIRLLDQLVNTYPALGSLRRSLKPLSEHAVDARYPGNRTLKRQATSALRLAERVRQTVRPLLGLAPKTPQRRKSP